MYSVILEGTNKVHVIQRGRNDTIYLSSFSLLNMCGVMAFNESACELSAPVSCSVDRTLPKIKTKEELVYYLPTKYSACTICGKLSMAQ